jgi:Flp pilus assembly protein TadD
VKAKDWNEAVARLQRPRRNPEHADLQNFLGYSYRNLKQFDLAFTHYKRALELDPRHRGAHEYIGEAYLMWAT